MHVAQEAYPGQVPIADLRPTQVTVGMREVDIRRLRWRDRGIDNRKHYLSAHRVPIVVGPDNRHYMIDRHHLTMALYDVGLSEVPVSIVGSFAEQTFEAFWAALEHRNWTHPFDDQGRRCAFEDMPVSIADLTDDPFRSLAGALKRMEQSAIQ
jgi:hypothetical protein